ncbi:zinc finger protein [Nannizzia gypsea CBS 118893]|uniref:Zinc finger protein n=1 Tax=Arthroderma gypseum (strain ATCC MYA-4604 / CBS 118893) TaxID=535722 RepID=E4UY68_ARTGP|nr:zinc finger protein [Nannizzia gypsea CBS 118893]EFR02031.1 zinc finger protein [Nannizzia gypsea CBS 118893]
MLALERPAREQSYLQQLPMDPSAFSSPLDSLDPQQQAFFGVYNHNSSLSCDPYPFMLQQPLALDSPLLYPAKSDLRLAPKPSGSPQFLPLSQLGDRYSSISSSASTHSLPSATNSSIGSPYQDQWLDIDVSVGAEPVAMVGEGYPNDFLSNSIDLRCYMRAKSFPLLTWPMQQNNSFSGVAATYPEESPYPFISSPAFAPLSPHSPLNISHTPQQQSQSLSGSQKQEKLDVNPSFVQQNTFSTPRPFQGRRSSISSIHPRPSARTSPARNEAEDDNEKGRCPHPDCGRVFRDLKAHMLTHQSERPEKCPIVTCEYHLKGFARKYDKNRHTLTHYKGTMVCGFCPGSGSAAEKSFNRADVFKRHLTTVHGVDQSAPNGRKKTPPSVPSGKLSSYCQDATGKCSTCTATFSSAQEFYEHLDDCVLRVVQQEEPSEAINSRRLTEVASDEAVRDTMERHMLFEPNAAYVEDSEDIDDATEKQNYSSNSSVKGSLTKSNSTSSKVTKNRVSASRRRNNRNNYPPSWSCPNNKMKMKRRLLCLYDGPRRLWKDEMMLDNEFEVRLKLPASDCMGRETYVTDLDIETLKRSEGVLNATEEEKGPWIQDPNATEGLIGPTAVPVIEHPMKLGDELNIDDLMG